MKAAAWVAVVLLLLAFLVALVQSPRAYFNLLLAGGLTALALAFALSVSHIAIT
jgi:hypothetical protein